MTDQQSVAVTGVATSELWWTERHRPSRLRALGRIARSNVLGTFGATVVCAVVVMALFAPLLAPYPPLALSNASLAGPSRSHLAGTDQFGRDVLSRIIYGARVSLAIAGTVVISGGIVGTFLGMITTYAGGAVDYIWQRIVDAVMAMPSLVLLLGILSLLRPTVWNVVIVLVARFAITNTRFVRATVLAVVHTEYIESARVIGASPLRVLLQHVLPNIAASLIVLLSVEVGGVILVEASLSFLGYGVPPPTPTWGSMLGRDGRRYMNIAPWMLIAPAVALSSVVFAVNVLGDALRDVLDPRLRAA